MTTHFDISDQTVSTTTTTTTTATTAATDEEVMAVESTDAPKGKPPFIGSIGDTNGYYLTLTTDAAVDKSKAFSELLHQFIDKPESVVDLRKAVNGIIKLVVKSRDNFFDIKDFYHYFCVIP